MESSSPAVQINPQAPQSPWRSDTALIGAFAAAALALHLATAVGYGIFRDELYFIVCGWRLDWGYVDHPPMVPLLARIGTALFGANQFGVRFPVAVVSAVMVFVTGLITRELGGRRFAQGMACLAVIVAPHYLGSQGKLATDSVEPLFWTLCSYVLVRIIKRDDPTLWPWFGLFAGLGLQTKHSTVFFGFAVMVSLVLAIHIPTLRRRKSAGDPDRKPAAQDGAPAPSLLWNRWFALAGAVAFAAFLPNLIWEVRHNWATLELLENVKNSNKNVVLGPGMYFLNQVGMMHPLGSLIWIAGVVWFCWKPEARPWRVFGWTYPLLFVIFVLLKGKAYYLASVYAVYFAAGATWLESAWQSVGLRRMRWVYAALLVVSTIPMLPLALPVFSPERLAAYQKAIGFTTPRTETSHTAELAQHFADRLGWEEMVASVARVYQSLPESERREAAIFAQNYGEAGAIDVLGRKYGLPWALSGHQNYFFWGTHGWRGNVLIVMDDDPGTLPELCTSVQDAGPVESSRWAMPWEQRQRLYVCRGLKKPLEEIWPEVKRWM